MKQFIHRLFGKRWLSSTLLHVTSEKEVEELNAVLDHPQTQVIPNLIAFPEQTEKKVSGNGPFNILFLGRMHPVKNLEFLLDVFENQLDIPFQLHLVGDGDDKYVKGLKQRASSIPNVEWHNELNNIEKWKFIQQSDLLVLPSRTENFANVVIEALSQGTPVLVSNKVGLKDFIEENELGWVERLDVEIWRNRLLQIWKDSSTRNRIQSKAPQIIRQYFDTSLLIAQYEKLYHSVMKV